MVVIKNSILGNV